MTHCFTDNRWWWAMLAGPVVWLAIAWLDLLPGNAALDWRVLAFSCLLYPVLEEFAFRGGLQGWLCDTRLGATQLLPGVSVANLIASAVFAAAHLINQPPLWALSVFVPAIVFGYFRDRYDGWLTGSIVLHCWYNSGFFAVWYGLF